MVQSNLVIRNVLIRNKLVLRNHFPRPNANLLHKDKELLALRNNFRVTETFLITKFDYILQVSSNLRLDDTWYFALKIDLTHSEKKSFDQCNVNNFIFFESNSFFSFLSPRIYQYTALKRQFFLTFKLP